MKTKVVKPLTGRKAVTKNLQIKLIAAVHKVLKENKAQLTNKIEKVVNKSIKKIVRKTDKHFLKALKTE